MDDLTVVKSLTDILTASGPWGLVAVLGWSFWRLSSRKEVEIKVLYDRFLELSQAQIESSLKVETALRDLKDFLSRLLTKK